MFGDAAFGILEWHDNCIKDNGLPIAPYNPRITDDQLKIGYRIEDRIEHPSEETKLNKPVLEEIYNRRTLVERTIGANKDCGIGMPGVRGCVCMKTNMFLALCLRLAIAIANSKRGASPGRTSLEVRE